MSKPYKVDWDKNSQQAILPNLTFAVTETIIQNIASSVIIYPNSLS